MAKKASRKKTPSADFARPSLSTDLVGKGVKAKHGGDSGTVHAVTVESDNVYVYFNNTVHGFKKKKLSIVR